MNQQDQPSSHQPTEPSSGQEYQLIVDTLRATQQRQEFLLRLNDNLAPIADPVEIQQVAARILGEQLEADRTYYAYVEGDLEFAVIEREYLKGNAPSVVGRFRFADFESVARMYRSGQNLVLDDVDAPGASSEADLAAYRAISVKSFLGVLLRKQGVAVASMNALMATPHHWTAQEIALMEETAERTWAAVERARAEEALQQSEEKYRTLFETMAEGLNRCELVLNQTRQVVDCRFIELNPAFERQTGMALEAVTGRLFSELFPEEDRSYWLDLYQQVFDTQSPRRFESYWEPIDCWLGGTISPAGGRNINIFYENVTQRKRAEIRQAFLLTLSDALRPLSDPLAIQETACRVLGQQLGANRVLYAETVDGIGMPALVRASDYTDGVPSRVGWHRLDDYGTFVTETWRAGRNLVWNSLNDLPALMAEERAAYEAVEIEAIIGIPLVKDGRFKAFLAVHHATARKWTAEEISLVEETAERTWAAVERAKAEGALHQASQRKDEFLAMLAHELRNPMSTLQNTIQLLGLTQGQDQSLPLDKALAMMGREVTHLNRMVDDLLDVSRISQGKIHLKKERLELGLLIREIIDVTRSQFTNRGQTLTTHLTKEPIWVSGDRTRLTQVVRNLLTNAAKYTPTGGQIGVTLRKESGQAVLRVRDNGIGIAADQLQAIFEIFVQVSSSLDRPQGGLGLGLAVVKQLVELHSGQVSVDSPGLGQGSEFSVSLPIVLDTPPVPAPDDGPASRAYRILVVDDNADLALTTAMLLRYKNYDTHSCLSGPEALETVETLQPAAILLDLGMPDMDGYETCRRLRKLAWGRYGVIVALSGYGQAEDQKRTKESGFDGHLVKPLNLQLLTELLDQLLNSNRLSK